MVRTIIFASVCFSCSLITKNYFNIYPEYKLTHCCGSISHKYMLGSAVLVMDVFRAADKFGVSAAETDVLVVGLPAAVTVDVKLARVDVLESVIVAICAACCSSTLCDDMQRSVIIPCWL